MKEPQPEAWRDLSWRSRRSQDDDAQLREHFQAHPETRAAFEEEAGLNRLLDRLPEIPVSSNFTAQVLQAIDSAERREARTPARPGWLHWLRARWLPRLALGGALCVAVTLGYQQYRHSLRQELALSVGLVGGAVEALPNFDVLQDFEAIQRMSQVPPQPDVQLLSALEP